MKNEIPDNMWFHGYRVRIYPTSEQKEFLDKCFDINRFIYNWTIEQYEIQLEKYNKGEAEKRCLTYHKLCPIFTKMREKNDFVLQIPFQSARGSVLRACKAYDNFFHKNARKPKFKSKKKLKKRRQSFDTRNDRMHFEDNMLKIEGLDTLIYTKYHSGYDKRFRKFKNSVITKDNMGNYYISFIILEPKPLDYFDKNNIKPLNRAIGIDLNVKKRFVLSTGKIYYGPDLSRELVNLETKQSRVTKDTNRRKKMEKTNPSKNCQSKRANKRLRAMQKQYKRVANIKENFIQTTTKKIISMRPKAIVMEALDVNDMLKNHNIAKHTYHANFGRCAEVMRMKCNKYNIPFMFAEKGYPSSQICSSCGNIQEIKLYQKKYKCKKCGLVIDRDINAALNLEHLAYEIA